MPDAGAKATPFEKFRAKKAKLAIEASGLKRKWEHLLVGTEWKDPDLVEFWTSDGPGCRK